MTSVASNVWKRNQSIPPRIREPPPKNVTPQKSTTSYGIILFTIKTGRIYYLLSQRRDTIEYSDYIRGIYKNQDLERYFRLMTNEEKHRLVNYTFDQLWDDLWTDHSNLLYHFMKKKAKSQFIDSKDIRERCCKYRSPIISTSWGFPKGRKNKNSENEIDCAIREFREETNMKGTIEYNNILYITPPTETFMGTNNKMYRTKYFVCYTNDESIPSPSIVDGGIRKYSISDEISELRWCNYTETIRLLDSYRVELLKNVDREIRNYKFHLTHDN